MNQVIKTLVFWMVIVVSAFLLWQVVKAGSNGPVGPEISYSKFMTMVANGQVNSVTIAGNAVRGFDAKGGSFRVVGPQNQATMLDALRLSRPLRNPIPALARDFCTLAFHLRFLRKRSRMREQPFPNRNSVSGI
jgi:ATP-dependent Zn protease